MAGEALENDDLQPRAIKISEMQRAITSPPSKSPPSTNEGPTYPLTPWLPSPSLNFASVPIESGSPGEERSMPGLGNSPEAGKMVLPHSSTNLNANSAALCGGAAVLHTPTPTDTSTSTQQQQLSSASSRTSISGSTNDVVVVTRHQKKAQHQHQIQAQHAQSMLMQNDLRHGDAANPVPH
ncbi:hypothetical protein OC834_003890 [Tilletia horrida]|nr:hypothetical protein OC834_003890 [Tilletia horrida]